jgi:hypothetical protein
MGLSRRHIVSHRPDRINNLTPQEKEKIEMRNNNAGCLSALLPAFSRIMLLMVWISRPVAMNLAFNTFILPCLGFMFLPFATLMYVWLIQGVGGIQALTGCG